MIDNTKLKEFFSKRIYELRDERNLSARELSLAMGQNSSYINRIENKLTLPSIQGFLCICECLEITPYEFFNPEKALPYISSIDDLLFVSSAVSSFNSFIFKRTSTICWSDILASGSLLCLMIVFLSAR